MEYCKGFRVAAPCEGPLCHSTSLVRRGGSWGAGGAAVGRGRRQYAAPEPGVPDQSARGVLPLFQRLSLPVRARPGPCALSTHATHTRGVHPLPRRRRESAARQPRPRERADAALRAVGGAGALRCRLAPRHARGCSAAAAAACAVTAAAAGQQGVCAAARDEEGDRV